LAQAVSVTTIKLGATAVGAPQCDAKDFVAASLHHREHTPMWSPVVNGIQAGLIVEIQGHSDATLNGVIGQVQEVFPAEEECLVLPASTGEPVRIKIREVREANCSEVQANLSDGHLDLMLGPRSNAAAISEVMKSSLAHKGFCSIRVLQNAADVQQAASAVLDAASQRELARLPSEIEEGYLGRGGLARVTWLDSMEETALTRSLGSYDNSLSILAEILQVDCENMCGKAVTERSAAMVCTTLPAALEEEYPPPRATNDELLQFYSTWTRGVLRLVLFLGPEAGTVVLTRKAKCSQKSVPEECVFEAPANTLLILREDCFEYSLEEPLEGDAVWMQVFLLEPAAEWNLDGEFTGDMSVMRPLVDGPPPPTSEQVAVCAVALQAGANFGDSAKEWSGYVAGVDGQLEMPLSRFDYAPYYCDDPSSLIMGLQTFVRHFSVQEGIELFDHKYFEVSISEASAMDPMHRQVLEVAALGLAQIGIDKKYCNKTSTHASCSVGNDKQEWNFESMVRPGSVAVNNQLAITSNRVSYTFNLKGGNYVCDTACSSSLVATHLGKRNLLDKRWDPIEFHIGMGTGLTLSVGSFIHGSAAGMLSPSGRCLTFNASANGYNRGDGTGGIIIKAGEFRDERVALLRGSEMGQDGRSASMSAPNGPAQERCSLGALKEAKMTPPESTVWECHGTGTALGDPIEVGAVRKVQIKHQRSEPLMIGTSKSNLGHLEGSAAVIAMCKCCMVCYHIHAAPTIHFRVLNPHLDHAMFDAFFCTEVNPYRYNSGHCQVSSFGVGGTNGHAIFWGESIHGDDEDRGEQLLKRVKKESGKVIVDGPDPENWHYIGPDIKLSPDSKDPKWTAIVERDPVDKKLTVRWEKKAVSEAAKEDGAEDEAPSQTFFAIIGNFNGWAEDRMFEGPVPGLWYMDVDIPDSGALLFRFLMDGDSSQGIGPVGSAECTRKTAAIEGPKVDVENAWRVDGVPGTVMRVELLSPQPGRYSVNWFKVLA